MHQIFKASFTGQDIIIDLLDRKTFNFDIAKNYNLKIIELTIN